MKKKLIVFAAVTSSILVVLWITARVTGLLLFFTIPTISNEPNIKTGDRIFSSNYDDPKLYNFIVFTSEKADSLGPYFDPENPKRSHYLHRLCGMPGNSIQMKDGVLFVDGKNFDSEINLNTGYKITTDAIALIDEQDMPGNVSSGMYPLSADTTVVTFDNKLYKKYSHKINLVPCIMTDTAYGAFAWYQKNRGWTVDNFGPIKIPANNYFVLGDNRPFALDSRYIGFVKKENIKGVVINR